MNPEALTPHHNLLQCARILTVSLILLTVAAICFAPQPAIANNLFEDGGWQFNTTSDRGNKAFILDLIERKNAGMYNNTFRNTYNIQNNYDIAGPYIDCNMTSQASGNQGSSTQNAPVGSPSISVESSTSASSSGNSGTTTVTSGGSDTSGLNAIMSDSSGTATNNTTGSGDSNSVNTNQSNDGSTQQSSASNNSFGSSITGVSGAGGEAGVALNSNQSLQNSPVTSGIYDSSVCNFNVVSDSIGSPINNTGTTKGASRSAGKGGK